MANNQSAISDVAQKGMKAASTLRSAVKVGKSIAAAAKGGAAGGWIGAVAAFAWENRRLVAAIIVGLVVILLLPVVIISMLPTLIFGGTGSAYSPMDADNPILNNPTVITENMEAVTTSVETVFSESLNVILEEIEQDKETLPENSNVMIVYPTVDESNINTANIISQYCAAKNQDYETVSVSDFEATIKNHKDKIYRYEKTEEMKTVEKTVTVVDSSTGEEKENIIITEEKFTVYTVFYNGEDYFADNIFNLSAEQKELAKDYSENLSLYLSGGI